MPSVNVYLTSAEYVKLYQLAESKNTKATLLAARYIKEGVRREKQ